MQAVVDGKSSSVTRKLCGAFPLLVRLCGSAAERRQVENSGGNFETLLHLEGSVAQRGLQSELEANRLAVFT